MSRVFNFGAGPGCLPLEVLEEAKEELLDYAGTGTSILESSHRGPEYAHIHAETQELFKELLGLDDDFHVLFFGGGASSQFAILPMNFLKEGLVADYVVTGSWSKKAAKEAKFFGEVNIAADPSVEGKFTRIPKADELRGSPNAAYLHLTSNNTIAGTQWHDFPEVTCPLVADMSSDLLWRPFNAKKFSLIYAGAQKNLGPAGVCAVIIRKDFLQTAKTDVPAMFNYGIQAENDSLYNTPPCFPIYMVGKNLRWIKNKGGLIALERENRAKGELLYGTIEKHADYYRCPVDADSRSLMNVVFRLPTEELEKKFISQAKERGMIGLKGHRSVGGIRVSTYNAVSINAVQAVCDFMESFLKENG